jgi:hypothetical protein
MTAGIVDRSSAASPPGHVDRGPRALGGGHARTVADRCSRRLRKSSKRWFAASRDDDGTLASSSTPAASTFSYFRPMYGAAWDMDRESMSIGAIAAPAFNVETIRFYQRKGLMPEPDKPYGSIRRYGASDLARVGFVKAAQRLGFTTAAALRHDRHDGRRHQRRAGPREG